jgi:molybdenum cofactor synthesis domain-containing protein
MRESRQRPRRPSGRPAPKVRPARGVPARAELVSIGRELLRGRIADRNARTLARLLTQRGVVVRRITAVDDNDAAVSGALREALGRNPHLVVTTGGLGPADDDRTLAGVAAALEAPLCLSSAAKEMVEASLERLRKRKFVADGALTLARERMCEIPVGSEPVANAAGVSPGVICRLPGGATLLCLPGSPDEALAVFEEAWPRLKIPGAPGRVAHREIESPTADESALTPLLDRLAGEYPGLWIASRPAGSRKAGARIVIRLEAAGDDEREVNSRVEGAIRRLLALAAGSP